MGERDWGQMAEDYVRILWKAEERGGDTVTTQQIAQALGVRNTTVSTNLRRLHETGLIEHEPYRRMSLTPAGRGLAERVVRRHRLLESFLCERLGYAWDEVDAEAEVLEHAVSDRFVDRLDQLLGFPGVDPHGDPIPRDGEVPVPVEGICVAEAPTGFRGLVVRVFDDDPEILGWLREGGLGLGSDVEVGARRMRGALVSVSVLGPDVRVLEVPAEVARSVWVAGPGRTISA